MKMAKALGLNVSNVVLEEVAGSPILLVEHFFGRGVRCGALGFFLNGDLNFLVNFIVCLILIGYFVWYE